ncbi:hypothetical protein Lal_00021839 [Lupinus albus]|nr:hypothetical protein Lal_00021839 [Lupinus albus]
MLTLWKNLNFLTIFKLSQTYATLAFLPRAAVMFRRRLVQDDGKFFNQIRVESLWRRRKRRVAGLGGGGGGEGYGEVAVVAANPARVEEENGDEESNGENEDGEEKGPSSNLKIFII